MCLFFSKYSVCCQFVGPFDLEALVCSQYQAFIVMAYLLGGLLVEGWGSVRVPANNKLHRVFNLKYWCVWPLWIFFSEKSSLRLSLNPGSRSRAAFGSSAALSAIFIIFPTCHKSRPTCCKSRPTCHKSRYCLWTREQISTKWRTKFWTMTIYLLW